MGRAGGGADAFKNGENLLIPRRLAAKGPEIRQRKAGDRIVLTRRDGRIWGHKKLKDWLIDRKVPTEERDALWFVCGDKVVFQKCSRRRPQLCGMSKRVNIGLVLSRRKSKC